MTDSGVPSVVDPSAQAASAALTTAFALAEKSAATRRAYCSDFDMFDRREAPAILLESRIADRGHEAQQFRNSTYLADAVQHLRDQGKPMPDVLLARTSPPTWEHIGFSGDFLWDRAAATADWRRPLKSRQEQDCRMINVPDPFTLSVVYMTTDAMPSKRRRRRRYALGLAFSRSEERTGEPSPRA